MNTLPVLIRREFWEHRALWIAPLVVAAALLLAATFGRATVNLPKEALDATLSVNDRLAVFAVTQWGLALFQLLVMLIVLFFYLLDCLYAERKDRSILFWKSLPVPDSTTVLSKLLIALVIVPLGVYVLALVTNLLFAGVLGLRQGESKLLGSVFIWDTGVWLQVQLLLLVGLAAAMLWYAPIAAYLMLVSSWARRNVFLWAVLPPVLALFVEEVTFNTDYVKSFLGHRLGGIWGEFGIGRELDRLESALEQDASVPPVKQLLETVDASAPFTSPDLWLGVVVAALLVWAAARIRRYRDDT